MLLLFCYKPFCNKIYAANLPHPSLQRQRLHRVPGDAGSSLSTCFRAADGRNQRREEGRKEKCVGLTEHLQQSSDIYQQPKTSNHS